MFSHRPALVNAERVWKKILKFVDKNPITGQLGTSLKVVIKHTGELSNIASICLENNFWGKPGTVTFYMFQGAGAVDRESKIRRLC